METRSKNHPNKSANKKRKRTASSTSDEGQDDSSDKQQQPCVIPKVAQSNSSQNQITKPSVAYTGPQNVMRCIGILPSLPIVTRFHSDSEDSDASGDDTLTTIMPPVARESNRHQ